MTTFILEILVIMAAAVAAFFALRPYVALMERGEAGMDPGDGVAELEGWPSCDLPVAGACIYGAWRSIA